MANCNDMPIAVVAMNCRFPGDSSDPEKFWQMLIEKRDAWTTIPQDRFNAASFYQSNMGTGASLNYKGAYFLKEDVGRFDPSFFNITESEAAIIDPQQRLQMECAYEAFEAASIPLWKLKGSKTGVFASSFNHDYEIMQFRDTDNMSHYHSTGVQVAAANRIAYFFDFKGPSITLDTACSGSSNALHLACQAIRAGEADQALVSGCTLMLDPEAVNGMNKLQFFGPNGRCYAFDERGSGYGRGEGAACVVLKPLHAALADGDPIRAIVRATATNQNGRTSTITIPDVSAQVQVGLAAYESCGLDPRDTLYVEAHGTGTKAGDPLEIEAIGGIFGKAKNSETETIVGSVKTNIGHLEPTSGLASLIKCILILEKGVIPAHLNYETPNPNVRLSSWNIRIPTTDERWKEGCPRRISINNLGVGGSNTHVIIESFDSYLESTRQPISKPLRKELTNSKTCGSQQRLVCLSAMTKLSCEKMVQALKAYCESSSDVSLDSLAYSLAKRWENFPWRWSVAASTINELITKLEDSSCVPIQASIKPRSAFVFAGQGAQWFAMGRELITSFPVFRETLEMADRFYQSLGADWSLIEHLSRDEKSSQVDDAAIGQPCSTALQIALVSLLQAWNVLPDCVIGHSSGEIAASYAAGFLSIEHALTVAYFRGLHTSRLRHLDNAPNGGMMAAAISASQAEDEIAALPHELSSKLVIACVNSPSSVTISGDRQAVVALADLLAKRGIFSRTLKVDVAYHSKDMQLIAEEYLRAIAHCLPIENTSGVEFWSSVRVARLQSSDLKPEYWIENLVSQVKFSQAVATMCRETRSLGVFIETSPHRVLDGPIKQITMEQNCAIPYASMLKRGANAVETAFSAVQQMLTVGVAIDLKTVVFPSLDQRNTRLLTDLPHYQWDHSARYWYQSAITARHLWRAHPYHELLGSRVPQSTSLLPQWRNVLKLSSLDWLGDHRVNDNIIFPGAGYLCIAMQAFHQYYSEKNFRPAQPKFLELRDIVFERGLLLDSSSDEVEIVCYLRPEFENARETVDSSYEFKVVSSSDKVSWHKHCRGTIVALNEDIDSEETNTNSDSISAQTFDRKDTYQKFGQIGLNYGPMFRTLSNGTIHEDEFKGQVQQARSEHLTPYIVHPATLDGIFQSMVVSHVYSRKCSTAMVPTGMDKLIIACDTYRSDVDMLSVRATSRFLGKSALNASATASKTGGDDGLSIRIDNFAAVVLESELADEEVADHGCYRMNWVPDLSTASTDLMQEICLKATAGEAPCPTNPLYAKAAAHFYKRALDEVPNVEDVKVDYLRNLWEYMRQDLTKRGAMLAQPFDITELSVDTAECQMLLRMGTALPDILRGEIDPLSLMLEDGLLYKYYNGDWVDYYYTQMSAYVRQMAMKTPALKMLEIGAGTGGTTLNLLQSYPVSQGFTYDFTDISAGFFVRAKETLAAYGDMIRYQKLDIESDPADQGFEKGTYDLVIASNVLHATKDIQRTLKNARALLKPGGQLLLLEVTRPTTYLHLVFGCLSGWWLGSEDERTEGPCLSGNLWLKHLEELGFITSTCMPDAKGDVDSTMSVIIATVDDKLSAPPIGASLAIIADPERNLIDPANLHNHLTSRLASPCKVFTWAETIPADHICVFTGRGTAELLIDGDVDQFRRLQSIVSKASGAVFLTSGALGDGELPTSAALTGLNRAIRSEADNMRFISIDVDATSEMPLVSEIISRYLFHESNETEFAIRGRTILVPRVVPDTSIGKFLTTGDAEEAHVVGENTMAVKLDFRTPGYLESLRFIPDDMISGTLNPDDVQIAVKAAGVNFRHVLYALGKFSAAEYNQRPAGECSGVIMAVGDNYKHKFNVGDRVVTSGIFNAFTTIVRCPAESTRRIPDTMDFNTAAQFPLTYLTAWFGLVNLAHIKKGDRVLVHSGTGAVGQAAIIMAQYFGAEVFTTCGNDDKKAFLETVHGVATDHIFSSKDYRFAEGILKATNGKGVDIILNSLSGEYIPESCRCLATFGRFIEIGKNDILGRSKLDMGIFNKSTSFIALDLSRVYELDKVLIGELLQKMIDMLSNGELKYASPLHIRNFGECTDAFRYMSTGKHIGKMVLDLSASADLPVTIPDFAVGSIRRASTYVVAGGLGGLGREICRWIAKQSDEVHLVVLSRSKNFDNLKPAQDLTYEIQESGASVHLVTCDVGNEESVRSALDHCKATLPPIRGVIQGAMVLRDCPFETMTPEQFRTVILPKVHGTQHLVKHLPPAELDFFIMLSSVVGIIGGPTQGNYVAASTFQDSYARYLTSIGQPTSVLDLGWMQGAGYVEDNEFARNYVASQGMQPVSLDTFFRALAYTIKRRPSTPEQSQVMIGLSHTLTDRLTKVARFSFLQIQQSASSSKSITGPLHTKSAQQVLSSCKSMAEATEFVSQKLLEKVSSLMSMPINMVKLEGSMTDYGIDSLIAIEIRNWMRQEMGCNLGTFEILGSKSIAGLGELASSRSRFLEDAEFEDRQGNEDKLSEKADSVHDSGIGTEMPPSPSRSRASTMLSDLPPLPVPSLKTTTSSLLKSLKLVTTPQEFAQSKAIVDDFIASEGWGVELQTRLLAHAKASRNWLSDLWIDKQYWELRAPLAPFTNYFGVHEQTTVTKQSETAALICTAVLQFQRDVEDGTMERDLLRDAAADMNQYKNMFNACRIPRKPKDYVARFEADAHRHVLFIRDGHFFKLSYEHEGLRLKKAQIKAAIDLILEWELDDSPAIGALTTLDRDTWADARMTIMNSSARGQESIEDIAQACFVMCLDSESPQTLQEQAAQIWFGKGINRWFDKPVQFVVDGSGRSGYVGEHSASDGGPSLRLNEYVQEYLRTASNGMAESTTDHEDCRPYVQPLPFPSNDELVDLVATARRQFDKVVGEEDIVACAYEGFGESALSSRVTNPNTCVQLIMNLAAYRLWGELKPNYEPVSLVSFADGRWTSCSMVIEEVLKFCERASDPLASRTDCRAAFNAAIKAHGKNVSTCADGQENTEAHLMALKYMVRDGEELPEIFANALMQKSQTWSLSASSLPSKYSHHYGFWQVTEDGVGIGHMIRPDSLDFIISSANGKNKELASHIQRAAEDVGRMMGIVS